MKIFSTKTVLSILLVSVAVFGLAPVSEVIASSHGIELKEIKKISPTGETATAEGIIIKIINWALGIAGLLSVGAVIWSGILFLLSAGNETRAAAAKKTLIYAIVGTILVLASFLIINSVNNLLTKDARLEIISTAHAQGVDFFDPSDPDSGPPSSSDARYATPPADIIRVIEDEEDTSTSSPTGTASGSTDKGFDKFLGKDGELAKKTGLDPGEGESPIADFIIRVIRFVLGLGAIIALGAVVFGGAMYVLSLGDDARVAKAKKIILYAIIGLIIMGGSFAIISSLGAIFVGDVADPAA